MRALLVHPPFPPTYWGFQFALAHAGLGASLPPLGLITLAALLPRSWDLRLADMNLGPLDRDGIRRADVVLTGGMHIQAAGMRDVIAMAREEGKPVAVGGPSPTTAPEWYDAADLVFAGEAEGRAALLAEAIERVVRIGPGRGPAVRVPGDGPKPPLAESPVPRFDLLDLRRYASMAVQFSRGCPFSCEFCDIVAMFGRAPRVKSPDQVIAEFEALAALGWDGSVFLVDDNFIGNRRAVRDLLARLAVWQRARRRQFELYTEASVDLARDPALVAAMREAGFASVFVGIESPSAASLQAAGKRQNVAADLRGAVDTMTRAGLEVMGGFIVGFDTDSAGIFGQQRRFLVELPVPLAMIGVLTALPGTQLWRRLDREGRLAGPPNGDQFGRPNFAPAMGEDALLAGYEALLADAYAERAYERRCAAFLERAPLPPRRHLPVGDFGRFWRILWSLGLRGPRRGLFWRLVGRALARSPRFLPWAVKRALTGDHMIRYTAEVVRPRLGMAQEAAARGVDRASRAPATTHRPPARGRSGEFLVR